MLIAKIFIYTYNFLSLYDWQWWDNNNNNHICSWYYIRLDQFQNIYYKIMQFLLVW